MLPLQYELPSKDDVDKCMITQAFIEGEAEVVLEYSSVDKEVN